MPLKLFYDGREYEISQKITVGRLSENTIVLKDGMVSSRHGQILRGVLQDLGSTNGTLVNGKMIKPKTNHVLKRGDIILFGDTEMKIEVGAGAFASPDEAEQDMMQSKRFLGGIAPPKEKRSIPRTTEEHKAEAKIINEMMQQEFSSIIGHDNIKKQLFTFHKKVQLDHIREANGKLMDAKRLYHMIFAGPPGTGKTTMANLVAKIMCEMKLIETENVVFVNNALDLLAGFAGQTPAKVDAKVEEAKGGVLFIDEAYSIVKSKEREKDSFGKEAIETIMKHLDPPTCVFIFAGYSKEMAEFLDVNAGLARRIPYRYDFNQYAIPELVEICLKMCEGKGEKVPDEFEEAIFNMLQQVPNELIASQNAGFINNWISFAQIERDDRLDIDEAIANPMLACELYNEDMQAALDKILDSTT